MRFSNQVEYFFALANLDAARACGLDEGEIKLIATNDRTHAAIFTKHFATRRYTHERTIDLNVWNGKRDVEFLEASEGMRNQTTRTNFLAWMSCFVEDENIVRDRWVYFEKIECGRGSCWTRTDDNDVTHKHVEKLPQATRRQKVG
jgi:hypothetical protein